MQKILFLLWCIIGMWTVKINGSNECGCRLPDAIVPQRYDLEIITNLENNNFNFNGRVRIKVRCLQPTKSIILHAVDLAIDQDLVKVEDLSENATIMIDNIKYDKNNEFLIINTVENLINGHDYSLLIPFAGELQNGLDGFYRSSYIDQKTNEKKWIAVTQFEPTDARKAFPCFDEPAMKAIFKISLGRTQNYTSISNMPIATTEPMQNKPNWFWDHYEESVPMSTYLVAFAVTDFEYISSTTTHNTLFRVWARSEAIQQVEFAKSVGPLCLEYYENFFNVSYPLPKQDMIAVPDFGAGAMENWGLITYREARLLYDPATSAAADKTSIAEVIAHELAHQWFGNLVTMKWWTDLWLNEGFATYMASLAVHHMFPKWNTLTYETASNLLIIFSKDSLKTSHPVSSPVGNPKEINEKFDTISYAKGSFLLHMMANFLGGEVFRKGVSNYLKEHKYNNAEQDDLWQALSLEAHLNKVLPENLTVKTIMDTWALQTGYPVVTVTRDYEKNSAKLTQTRFLRDVIKTERVSIDCWWIPITYTTEKKLNFVDTRPYTWLSCPSEDSNEINNLPSNEEWVLFNLQAAGLYRVNYDPKNWELLTATLNSDSHHKIPVLNKVQLIDDSANLAWVGDINYTIYFDVLQYLKCERGYLPWHAALSNIGTLDRLLRRTSTYGLFKLYMKELLTPIYNHVGGFAIRDSSDDNLENTRHQLQITSWSCRFEVGECVNEATKLFEDLQKNPKMNSIPNDLKSTVYCNAIRNGGEKEWNYLWKQYQTSNSATEKNTILQALTCTKEMWLLQRYMEWAITSNSGIRLQDSVIVLQAISSNSIGYYLANNFLHTRIGDIYKYLSSSSRRLGRLLTSLANQMINDNDYNEFKRFIEANQQYLSESAQSVNQSLETIKVQIQWHARHYEEIKKLLPEYLK